MLNMAEFTVTDKDGRPVVFDDVIINFRGEWWVFLGIVREKSPGKSAKVRVREMHSGWTQDFYAEVFNLTIKRFLPEPKSWSYATPEYELRFTWSGGEYIDIAFVHTLDAPFDVINVADVPFTQNQLAARSIRYVQTNIDDINERFYRATRR